MIHKSPTLAAATTLLLAGLLSAAPAEAKLKEAEVAFQARDFATALKELKPYFKKKRQPVKASLMMARMYLDGLGVPVNYSRAYQYLQRPAKSGNAWAATELGKLYLTGSGVMQSFDDARGWFEKAARHGYAPAQVELGHIHRKGLSLALNKITAYAWYNLAAASLAGEDRDAVMGYRDALGGSMTPQEIDIAQARSLDWSERIEVVEPEVFSLLDQAAILAEEKLDKAADELEKLRKEIEKQVKGQAAAKPADAPAKKN
jgi:TPR repeat protein